MAVHSRLRAPALSSLAAALLLAVSFNASAVPMPVEQADRNADTASEALSNPHQATALPLMAGTPSGTAASVNPAPVVEPGTLALMGLGLVIVGLTTSARARARRGGPGKKH